MSNDKKPNNKKPKISPYWIYGSIIVIFLAINLFSGGMGSSTGSPTTPAQFFQYLENGDVDKVEIINRREAKVYLTNEAASQEVHRKTVRPSLIPMAGKSPNYQFELGDLQRFEEKFEEVKKENSELTTVISFKTDQNVWGDFLLTLLYWAEIEDRLIKV